MGGAGGSSGEGGSSGTGTGGSGPDLDASDGSDGAVDEADAASDGAAVDANDAATDPDDAAADAGDGDADADAGDAGDLLTPSEQLAAVRAAVDGTGLELPVNDVYVTYTKPAIGTEDAGFFVQAEASGPAIFVAIDPTTLSPSLQVGDLIDFTVTSLTTTGGLRQVTELTGLARTSSGNSIEPLITEVSAATDLLGTLDDYESRVVRVTGLLGTFAPASTDFVAAPIATVGVLDANLRLRIPSVVRDELDLGDGCTATVDYGVMWRFNTIAQPSVYSESDLVDVDCPAPTVVSASALDSTHVTVTFDRAIAAATATSGRFTFDNGVTASAVAINGAVATVTTSALSTSTTYTVSVSPLVTDLLGAGVASPNSATFVYQVFAVLALNEINPNIAGTHDLIELLALSNGTINGITVVQRGAAIETLVTLPDLALNQGDLVVVHLNSSTATGAAPASESLAKNEHANAMYSANYDGAWDIHGGGIGLTFSNRVLEVRTPGSIVQDVAPFVVSNSGSPPAAFPALLQGLQGSAMWFPTDCAGDPCTYATTPSAVDVSIDYLGCGTTATGNSIQRKIGGLSSIKSDWNAAGANSWGLPNP